MIQAIVFLPLLGALIAGLFSRSIAPRLAQLTTTGFLCISALLASIVFYDVTLQHHSYTVTLLRWIQTGQLDIRWALRVDSVTAVMLVVVTYVSSVVHLYSIGYMSHDPHIPRFMSYLSLFTFFMLLLVTADNLVQLFVGWEGVGLCSYLLIGFWYTKPSANAAAMKAFIVNRVGDFSFMLGICSLFLIFGTVQFDSIFAQVVHHKEAAIMLFGHEFHALTVIGILLFIGSMGKSAQLGLHTWLPDAMEGPTPVSALIHAATMVTAGVFLVVRCSPLFEYAPVALAMITIVGAVTCLFAATIAITQQDIKRIIAYSTCSQLGYMFFACGVSAYSAAMFHLMTHAFFKALLFLGAGSVIHALSGEQNIYKMGGIWKKIPLTYSLMWIGSLALAGIYPFAGFFSKDIILEAAYAADTHLGYFAEAMGLIAAFLTAFYSWRLLILVFHGASRSSEEVQHHIHESPAVMLIPLYILAFGAVTSGWIGDKWLHIVEASSAFWGKSLLVLPEHPALAAAHHVPLWVKLAPLGVGIAGIVLAYLCYMVMPAIPTRLAHLFAPLYRFLVNKWYFDELYEWCVVRPVKLLGKFLWKICDAILIDGLPNGAAWMSSLLAGRISKAQSGYIYHYVLVMLMGVVGLISWYVWGYVK